METLFWVSSGLHPEPIGSHRGLPAEGVCWDYNAPDALPDIIGGVRFSEMTLEADFGGPISYARRVATGWGKAHKAAMREQFGRMLSIGGIGENLTDPKSFIDLDPQEKDPHGLPKARIHSHLAEMEIQRLAFIQKISRQALEALVERCRPSIFFDVNLRPPWWEESGVYRLLEAAEEVKMNEDELAELMPGPGTAQAKAEALFARFPIERLDWVDGVDELIG